jgi:hypothetical protein
MEKAEVKRLNAVGSITLPTCHMPILEQSAKVAAFVEAAAESVPQK